MADKEKFEVLLRLKAIELIAYWEGRLVTSQLIKHFGISRQQASKDIKRYITHHNPDSLDYSIEIKGYQPAKNFKPKLTNGHINEYMDLMSGLVSESVPITLIQDPHIAAVHLPSRSVMPEIVRVLIQACRSQTALEIEYASMNNPKKHTRVISPHSLIYTGFRWHIRGYCHERDAYRDFIVSRITKAAFKDQVTYIGLDNDVFWNDEVEIRITPNSLLSDDQKSLIATDFSMTRGLLKLKIKKALAHYTLQRYQVGVTKEECKNPSQFPLQLQNGTEDDVSPYLFNGGMNA